MVFGLRRIIKQMGIILSIFWLASCGGGGGGNGTEPAFVKTSFSMQDLTGEYRLGHLEFVPESSMAVIDVAWNGAGNWTGAIYYPITEDLTGVHTLDTDGTITVDSAMTGQLSLDGNTLGRPGCHQQMHKGRDIAIFRFTG